MVTQLHAFSEPAYRALFRRIEALERAVRQQTPNRMGRFGVSKYPKVSGLEGQTITNLTVTNLTTTTETVTNITVTNTLDAGGATNFEIPNGTSVTTNVAGEIAIDTNGDGTNVTQGWIQFYDGTRIMYAPSIDAYPTVNGSVLTFNSTTDKLEWSAPGAGTVTIAGDTGGAQSGPDFVFTTDVDAAYTVFQFSGSSNTLTLQIPLAASAQEGIISVTTSDIQVLGKGPKEIRCETSATDTSIAALTLTHNSTGTPTTDFGVTQAFNLETSTTANVNAASITVSWVTATHASRVARIACYVTDSTGGNELWRGELDGSGNSKIGFLGADAVARQTSGADLTNNVTSGGTNDTIANFTDLTTYANDAATIRNDIYQLARKVKQLNDALRDYGLFD